MPRRLKQTTNTKCENRIATIVAIFFFVRNSQKKVEKGLRYKRVLVVMKKDDADRVQKRADAMRMTVSAYIRYMLFKDDKQN